MSPPPSATGARRLDPEPSEPGENLFVDWLVMARSSQKLEPPANPGRFTIDRTETLIGCAIERAYVDKG